MYTGDYWCNGRGQEGVGGHPRRLPRERAELARTAAGPQGAWLGRGTEGCGRRWCVGLLGGVTQGVRQYSRAAMLGAQDGQRAELSAQGLSLIHISEPTRRT